MLILIFALVVLVGGVFLIAKSISNKKQASNNPTQNPLANVKKEPANLFGQDAANNKNTSVDVTGTVGVIAEKTLTIKTTDVSIAVNINGATPVMLQAGNVPAVVGQMADLKKGDSVKVTYDQTSKNAQLIFIMRAQTPAKAK